MRIKPSELLVGLFVVAYMAAFTIWFLSIGNYEFIVYIVTMIILLLLVGSSLRSAEYPLPLLWALAIWGLIHMAGGGVPVGDGVLYGWQMIPITSDGIGEMTLLKYDQVAHAYGFGVAAWVLWHLLARHFPETRGTRTIYVYPLIGSMGLGALNEMIEFSAVLAVQDTGVGGYYNTALDLVFNAMGAVVAVLLISRAERRNGPAP